MLFAAGIVWAVIAAIPSIAKSFPVREVIFTSSTSLPLSEIENDVLKRVADAIQTRQATMLQLDLASLRNNIKQLPWVREAYVRRQFPASIVVSIEEHKPSATWVTESIAPNVSDATTSPQSLLVNSYGELFMCGHQR